MQTTYRRIIINFVWAFFFNIIGIPLAAGMFHPLGVQLPPWAAGLAMASQVLARSRVDILTSGVLVCARRLVLAADQQIQATSLQRGP
eukprot:753136-Hanusia_phi.AAC.7